MGQSHAKKNMACNFPTRHCNYPTTSRPDRQEQTEPVEPMAHAHGVPVSCEKFSFVDNGLSKRILSGFHKQWTEGRYLDVTITVGSASIRAHKCVLSSFSQYFEALFSSNMRDAALDVIPLHGISENAVKLLINFAYSGCVEIAEDNVQDLLLASSYLCIDSVIHACCDYLVKNLSVENCIEIHELAGTLGLVKMKDEAETFMVSHFKQMLSEGQFLRMNHETLRALLETDKLIVTENSFLTSAEHEEKMLVDAVLRYVSENSENRRGHLTLLLSRGIRLLLLQKETIKSLKSSALVASSPECMNLLNRILRNEISEEECQRWERQRYFLVEYDGTRELANTENVIHEATTQPFDDSSHFREGERFFIVGMKLHTRNWDGHEVIGAMEVLYNTGLSVVHGSKNPETDINDAEFSIGKDEYITEINVQAGWMVDRLEFKTNKGKVHGPYGGDGGGQRRFKCPCEGAYLAYITGTLDVTQGADAVRKLRFFWGVPKALAAKQSKRKHPKRPMPVPLF